MILTLLLFSFLGFADLDSSSQEALEQTKALLKNREAREKAANENQQSQQAHDRAQKLMGSAAGTDALYGLSAEVLDHIVKTTNGDSKEMQSSFSKRPLILRLLPIAYHLTCSRKLKTFLKKYQNQTLRTKPS